MKQKKRWFIVVDPNDRHETIITHISSSYNQLSILLFCFLISDRARSRFPSRDFHCAQLRSVQLHCIIRGIQSIKLQQNFNYTHF